MKALLSQRQLYKELGLSYDQGLAEVRKGNLVMLRKPGGENLYADRSEVVRWRLNRNREALGLAPIQPPTTAQELMVLDMLFMYKKDPDDEMYYMTDYERDWVAKRQEEEANAKEEVEVAVENTDEEVEINQDVDEVSDNDKQEVEVEVSKTSDNETEEDSEADTNETDKEVEVSVEESEEEEDEVDNKEEVDSKKE